MSSTLFINESPSTRKIIEEWELKQKNFPARWDQKVLQDIIDEWESKGLISIKRLTPKYAFIFDISKDKYGSNVIPKIEKLQASRDKHWSEKFKRSNILKRFLLKIPFLKRITHNSVKRQHHVNRICKELGIDVKLKLIDLI